jgi:peptidyl-prolyl cis-trans isomerase C
MRRAWPAALALLACSNSPSATTTAPPPTTSTLPAGVVADVGSIAIGAQSVAAVASARQIPPRDALDREIRDALFASAALRADLDQHPATRAALRGALARATLESLKQEAAQADPTDAEIDEGTRRHFVELDRPEGYRVTHVVVRVAETADAASKARAKALAERIAERVASVGGEADFKAAAESVDRGGLEVMVQSLPVFAADGRVLDERALNDPPMVLPFARAASHLAHAGQKSGVVATEFGYHVIMLLERTPALSVPFEERKIRLRDEIIKLRARKLKEELLSRIKSTLATNVERSADALLSTVDVVAHETP